MEAPTFGQCAPLTFGFGTCAGTTPAFGLRQPAAVTVAPAFGADSTAGNSFRSGQSAVVPALGASLQPATIPLFSFGQQHLQQHDRFH